MKQIFCPGDTVKLKSGSLSMTAITYRLSDDEKIDAFFGISNPKIEDSPLVLCQWIGMKKEKLWATYHQDVLEKVK